MCSIPLVDFLTEFMIRTRLMKRRLPKINQVSERKHLFRYAFLLASSLVFGSIAQAKTEVVVAWSPLDEGSGLLAKTVFCNEVIRGAPNPHSIFQIPTTNYVEVPNDAVLFQRPTSPEVHSFEAGLDRAFMLLKEDPNPVLSIVFNGHASKAKSIFDSRLNPIPQSMFVDLVFNKVDKFVADGGRPIALKFHFESCFIYRVVDEIKFRLEKSRQNVLLVELWTAADETHPSISNIMWETMIWAPELAKFLNIDWEPPEKNTRVSAFAFTRFGGPDVHKVWSSDPSSLDMRPWNLPLDKLLKIASGETKVPNTQLRTAAIYALVGLEEDPSSKTIQTLIDILTMGHEAGRILDRARVLRGQQLMNVMQLIPEYTEIAAAANFALGRIAKAPRMEKHRSEALKQIRWYLAHAVPPAPVFAAAHALLAFEGERAIGEVIAVLPTLQDDRQVMAFIILLSEYGEAALKELFAAVKRTNSKFFVDSTFRLVRFLGSEAVPILQKGLGEKDLQLRSLYWSALVVADGEVAYPLVSEAYKKAKDPQAQLFYLDLMGRTASEKALPLLENLISSTSEDIGAMAADGLGKIASKRSIPALVRGLKEGKTKVREWCTDSLGKISDPTTVEPLGRAVLHDSEEAVRYYAVLALAQIANDECLPLLEAAQKDKSTKVAD
jgi:hypothetical protein